MSFLRSTGRSVLRCMRTVPIQHVRRSTPVLDVLPSRLVASSSPWTRQALFSTTRSRLEAESEVNAELGEKLGRELALEKEMRDPDELPEHLREFLDNTPFKIQDEPGNDEVLMTRTFGDEKIAIRFSVDDLNNADEDPDNFQDDALGDEFDGEVPNETQPGSTKTKGTVNQGKAVGGNFKVAPEDSVEDENVPDQDSLEPGFPAHLLITIERSGKGAIQFEAVAQDGLIAIDSIYFYKDVNHADPKTTADEKAASRVYTGPQFSNLDEDLQVLFEQYLSERGVNTTLALFVPEYIDFKEQREYMNWLADVKSFVE